MKYIKIPFIFLITYFLVSTMTGYSYEHTFSRGDTLYSIAKKYSLSVQTILDANNQIKDVTKISVGTKIIIPINIEENKPTPSTNTETTTYKVKRGDSFYSISRKYSISVNELLALNNLNSGAVLKAGQVLKVPDSTTPTPGGGLLWPVAGVQKKTEGKLPGILIYGKEKDSVTSVCKGKVVWVGPYRGYGNVIMVESAKKNIYIYGGNDLIYVSPGDFIKQGDKIALLGLHPHEEKAISFFSIFNNQGDALDVYTTPRE